nr:hypothetical protein MIMGU_mgv1a019797mg [Ipomoea trifida]
MGTPHQTLSRREFQPQCDTKPPTAGWDSTASCGAHPITLPTAFVRSRKPSGRTSAGFSAVAISVTCFASKLPKLPKHRNTTEETGWSSSHLMMLSDCDGLFRPCPASRFSKGPTGYIGGKGVVLQLCEGVHHDPLSLFVPLDAVKEHIRAWVFLNHRRRQSLRRNRVGIARDGQFLIGILVPASVFLMVVLEGLKMETETEKTNARSKEEIGWDTKFISNINHWDTEHVNHKTHESRTITFISISIISLGESPNVTCLLIDEIEEEVVGIKLNLAGIWVIVLTEI